MTETTINGLCKVSILIILGAIIGLFIINHDQWGYITKLESRIEVLEMEAYTNKLLLKQTQRLVVPNERALKEKIK